MKRIRFIVICFVLFLVSCAPDVKKTTKNSNLQAKDILGNPEYLAISYGGYRFNTRDVQPTVEEIQEDMRILSALGIRVIRTYNVHLPQAENILKAIRKLKQADASFEMYVMLGAWISCENAFNWEGDGPNHQKENPENEKEIAEAIRLANTYSDIVKIIAVGNEAMVHWAASYFVQAKVILKWVLHLQKMKKEDKLPRHLWITSSDDFASWGGGSPDYKNKDLIALVQAVDFVSMHTYPFHNTHYNPAFWRLPESEEDLSKKQQIELAMNRALVFAQRQYDSVKQFVGRIDATKPVHIGETGWATTSNGLYGEDGSRAADAYKQALYYNKIRKWTNANNISCFYFEAFDENWKDVNNIHGSENHFGLFTIEGQAKFVLWPIIKNKQFAQLGRTGRPINKFTLQAEKSVLEQAYSIPFNTAKE